MEKKLLDIPNGRSSHTLITPRGGGIAFVAVFIGSTVVFEIHHYVSLRDAIAFLSGALIALIGYLDDCRGLSIRLRLTVQVFASSIAVALLTSVPHFGLSQPLIVSIVLYILLTANLVWLTNLFNFMDGIDGLAASEAVCVSSICVFLTGIRSGFTQNSLLFGVFAIAVIGFLFWNWFPAQIFMGDAGSCFLGFTLGVISIRAVIQGQISIWSPIILLGIFFIDATMTLLKRMLRGETWYRPHRLHAFQHASQAFGHRRVTLAVILFNIFWLAPWAYVAQIKPRFGLLCFVFAWLPLFGLAYLFHAGEVLYKDAIPRFRTFLLIIQCGFKRPTVIKNIYDLIRDNSAIFKAIVISMFSFSCSYIMLLADREMPYRVITSQQLVLPTVFALCQTITLLGFGLHRCHWHLISIAELPNIVGMCLASTLFAVIVAFSSTHNEIGNASYAIFVLDALVMVISILIAHIIAAALTRENQANGKEDQVKRVVIYGADAAGVSISTDLRRLGTRYRLVGFVDARKSMTGIQLAGGRVLGSDDEIKKLVNTYNIDHVLISSSSIRTSTAQLFLRQCRSDSIDYRIIPSIETGIESRSEAKRQRASAIL